MEITHRSETILIVQDKPHPLRLLISIPFFAAACYFLYHLILSLLAYARDGSLNEWMGALPGMFVLLIFALAISLPGLYLAAKDSLVVNRNLGVIGKRKELLGLHTRGKLASISSVEKVVSRQQTHKHVDRKPGSTSGRTSSVTVYPVELHLTGGDTLMLNEFSDKSDARKLVAAISEFSGIPKEDRLK